MLTPVKNEHTNLVLGAPLDWDESDGECVGLPCHRSEQTYTSFWKLTWRQRVRALLGLPVRLVVFGAAHPPVSLEVTKDLEA